MKRLEVSLNFGTIERPLGQLGWDHDKREAVFEWGESYRADPLPLSPIRHPNLQALLRPRGSAFEGLPGLFSDSLPDGWGRLLLDRELRASGHSPAEISQLDRLAFVGTSGMGALTYRPDRSGQTDITIDLDWIARTIPQVEEAASQEELARLRQIGGSSQGARPKFVAQISPDGTELRTHQAPCPTDWRQVLIKRRARIDPLGSIEAELAYATMAKAAGIDMQPCGSLLDTSGEAWFVTERFDRNGSERLHMQTVAGLLEVDFRSATMDYAELIKVVRIVTRDLRLIEQIFRRMVFNVRALNRDDHLKNHAFLMDAQGQWRLSPAYDLSHSLGPGGEHSLLVGGEGRTPGRDAFARVADSAGLKPQRALEIIDQVDTALDSWNDFADSCKVPRLLRKDIADDLVRARSW